LTEPGSAQIPPDINRKGEECMLLKHPPNPNAFLGRALMCGGGKGVGILFDIFAVKDF
jgi:hypothetical protein